MKSPEGHEPCIRLICVTLTLHVWQRQVPVNFDMTRHRLNEHICLQFEQNTLSSQIVIPPATDGASASASVSAGGVDVPAADGASASASASASAGGASAGAAAVARSPGR